MVIKAKLLLSSYEQLVAECSMEKLADDLLLVLKFVKLQWEFTQCHRFYRFYLNDKLEELSCPCGP